MRHRVIFILLIPFLFGCSSNQNESSVETLALLTKEWAYPDLPDSLLNYYADNTHIAQVCQVLPPDSLQTFGNIRGMGCDKYDNLFIWDDGYLALWKFSSNGEKIWRKKFNKGNEEGAFNSVKGAFAVSRNGQICIGDFQTKSLTILDSDGNYKNKFNVGMFPATITFGKDESIYVAGFEMSYKGPLIHHYSDTGEFLSSFCERDESSKLVMMTGNSGRLITDIDGNIYYSFFYPYKIEKYSPEGKFIKTLKREIDNFQSPYREEMMVKWTSGLRGITTFPSNLIGVAVVLDNDKQNWGIDFFNTEGEWLKYFSNNENDFPNKFRFRYWIADSKGNIYFDIFTKTEPVVVKYHVNFNKLN